MTAPLPPETRFQWRHQYDELADAIERDATDIVDITPSMTQQHHAKDADINEIVRRFGVTDGAIPPLAVNPDYFGDFTDVPDFRESLDRTRLAIERFNALPADIRRRFNNNPLDLWDFVQNAANDEESMKLGLLFNPAAPPAPPVEEIQP